MRGNLDPYLPQSTEKAVPVGGQLYSFDPQDKFAEILQQPAPCATLPPLPAASEFVFVSDPGLRTEYRIHNRLTGITDWRTSGFGQKDLTRQSGHFFSCDELE